MFFLINISYPCTICSKTFKQAESLYSHSRGTKHKKNALLAANPSLILPFCAVCSKTFLNVEKLESHMQKRQHRKKTEALGVNPSPTPPSYVTTPPSSETALHFCETCSRSFKTDGGFRSHMQSKSHKKVLLALTANASSSSTVTNTQTLTFAPGNGSLNSQLSDKATRRRQRKQRMALENAVTARYGVPHEMLRIKFFSIQFTICKKYTAFSWRKFYS